MIYQGLMKPVAALGLAAVAFTAPALAESQTRSVDPFDVVEIAGAAEVYITVGGEQSVEVDVDRDGYLERVDTSVRGGTLIINQRGRWRNADLVVRITVPELNGLVIDGAGDIEATGIDSEMFEVEIAGAGDVTLSGVCVTGTYEIDGAGDINATEFRCENVEVEINGAGDAEVYASNSIIAELNGVGDVEVYGDPQNVRPTINGFGSFELK